MMQNRIIFNYRPKRDKFDLGTCRFIQMIRYIIICIARINDKYKARFILRLINDN